MTMKLLIYSDLHLEFSHGWELPQDIDGDVLVLAGDIITPDKILIDNQENINRAKSEWPSLELEIGEVPDFDECFEIAKIFYKSLPWE